MELQWNPNDVIVYRLPTDPAGVWRNDGYTLADLERQHELTQKSINLAQLVEILTVHIESGYLARMEFSR